MYGKHFESMYTGSMFGKPFAVYAVWGYVISHMRQSRRDGKFYIELNPELLAATFAATAEDVLATVHTLCDKDLASRSEAEEGRRLIPEFEGALHKGPMQFWVVNGKKYRDIREEEERREYNRRAKRKQRERQASQEVNHVIDCQRRSAMSANTDPDPDPEADPEADPEEKRGDARGNRKIEIPSPGIDQLSGPDLVDAILPGIGYAKPRPARRVRNKAPAVELTDDWQPAAKCLEALCSKHECEPKVILSHLPDFRLYWIHEAGAGTLKAPFAWDSTFRNRIDQLAGYGRLHIPKSGKGTNKHGPPQPSDTSSDGWLATTLREQETKNGV